MSTSTVLPST